MRVKKANLTKSETSVAIDLFEGRSLTESQKKLAREQVGEFLVEQTLISINEQKSPVAGEGWKSSLSPQYKKKKKEEIGTTVADLQFRGRMLDQVGYRATSDGVKIGVFGERAPAADGHNNLSGKSLLPKRRFLPAEGQSYKGDIEREVDRIMADIVAETGTFDARKLREISTSKDLYAYLATVFGELSKSELKLIVFRNIELLDLLTEEDLLDLL